MKLVAAGLLLASFIQPSNDGANLDLLTQEVAATLARHSVPDMQLSYESILSGLPDEEALRAQRRDFAELRTRLDSIDPVGLPVCDRIDHARLAFDIERADRRAELALAFPASRAGNSGAGLHTLSGGEDWYRYVLYTWLGETVSFDDLFAFGEAELAEARARYEDRLAALGLNGNDAFQAYWDQPGSRTENDDEILATLDAVQARVNDMWAHAFSDQFDIQPVEILRSDLGPDFLAEAYYTPETGQFFYNLLAGGFDRRSATWLYLHEAIPGHHYQTQIARTANFCESRMNAAGRPPVYVFVEGWAAYVEDLAREFGVYATIDDDISAIRWDLVRSVRVALDVGINAYGWSDEQAMQYWQENVPGLLDVAEREITRVRRWPAQAITYKYGAFAIEQARNAEQSRLGAAFDLADFHDRILGYGDRPLDLLTVSD